MTKRSHSTVSRLTTLQQTVKALQRQLADSEKGFDRFRGANSDLWEGPDWQALNQKNAGISRQLSALTGNPYGVVKLKVEKPSDALLMADYAAPWDIPEVVLSWLESNASLLTSDATDAVRWWRIIDTCDEARYDAGAMTIYRAVEPDYADIRPGDWVTTSEAYAQQHLAKYLNGRGAILESPVDGRDVLVSPTGNDEEAIYAPLEYSGLLVQDECDDNDRMSA